LPMRSAILGPPAPDSSEPGALREIERLRAAGEIVVTHLPGHDAHAAELGCDRELRRMDGRWAVVARK
jgi:ATP phosphoribosyltransferase regulatory subunit